MERIHRKYTFVVFVVVDVVDDDVVVAGTSGCDKEEPNVVTKKY